MGVRMTRWGPEARIRSWGGAVMLANDPDEQIREDSSSLDMGRPGSAAWRLPGHMCTLDSTFPYWAPAETRNQLRLRAALWTTSR